MKAICTPKNGEEATAMAYTILEYLKGSRKAHVNNNTIYITEKMRQFYTWGARAYTIIASECGCYGLQFKVSGLLFKGRVRVYYNPYTDYFDVEFLRPTKNEVVKHFEDVDFMQLHNICHQTIERTDDMEV